MKKTNYSMSPDRRKSIYQSKGFKYSTAMLSTTLVVPVAVASLPQNNDDFALNVFTNELKSIIGESKAHASSDIIRSSEAEPETGNLIIDEPIELTTSTVSFSWVEVPNAVRYIIKRNNEEIAVLTGTNFFDEGLTPNTLYQYEIIAENAFSQTEPYRFEVKTNNVQAAKKSIAAGTDHSAAISYDGYLYTWGYNINGQLGLGDRTSIGARQKLVPTKVENLERVTSISLGRSRGAAIDEAGYLYTWGSGASGMLGHGNFYLRDSPTKVESLNKVEFVDFGVYATAAITEGGVLYTWGQNNSGHLGHNDTVDRNIPTKVNGLENVKSVSVGTEHMLAVTEDGFLYSWGANDNGQLGLGDVTTRTSPVKVDLLNNVRVAKTYNHANIVLTEDGSLYTWGANPVGVLGHGDQENKLVPTKVEGISNVKFVDIGPAHAAAITEDGSLYTWGNGGNGRLGHGDQENKPVPTKVEGISNVVSVSLGSTYSMALTEDGLVYTWGNNTWGPLGHGDSVARSVPTRIEDFVAILPSDFDFDEEEDVTSPTLESPQLTVFDQTTNSVSLDWEETEGATEYILERRLKPTFMYSALSVMSAASDEGFTEVYRGSGTTFTDSSVGRGTHYEYRIQAVNAEGGASEPTYQDAYTYQLVTFNWFPVEDEDGEEAVEYIVERNGEEIGRTSDISFTDDKAVPGETNLYRAIPVFDDGSEGDPIDFDDVEVPEGDGQPNSAPTLTIEEIAQTSVTLSFTAVEDADEYILYRDGIEVERFTEAGRYVDETVAPNTTYQYTIHAKNENGQGPAASQRVTTPIEALATPQNLRLVDVTSRSAELAWDHVTGAEAYEVYRDGRLIMTVTEPRVTDTDLAIYRTYEYEVVAISATGKSEPASLSVTTENEAPEAPTRLRAEERGQTTLTLRWTESERATSYRLTRNGAIVYEGSEPTFVDTGLAANTTYDYEVVAINAVGESEGTTERMTTLMEPPEAFDLSVTDIQPDSVTLSWPDVDRAVSYTVYRNGRAVATLSDPGYVDEGLEPATTYTYYVVAANNGGESTSERVEVTTVLTRPEPVTEVRTEELRQDAVTLGWRSSRMAEAYKVLRDGVEIGTTDQLRFTDSDVSPDTDYTYEIVAVNDVGESEPASHDVTTLKEAPDPIENLRVTELEPRELTLEWDPAAGADSYRISRNGDVVGTVEEPVFHDENLTPEALYSYEVVAMNNGGEAEAGYVSVTTPTPVPDAVSNLTVEDRTQESITLSWLAAPYATEYRVLADGVELGRTTATTFTDSGLQADTAYRYEVIGLNDVGEGESAHVEAQTLKHPPEPVAGLIVTDVTGTTVALAWDGSERADSYLIVRNGVRVGETTEIAYEDRRLTPDTVYDYVVIAKNNGGESDPAEVQARTEELEEEVDETIPPRPDDGTGEEPDEDDDTGAEVGPDFIRLSWYAIQGASHYEVYRDGVPIEQITDNGDEIFTFVDQPIDPTVMYHYQIVPIRGDGSPIEDDTPEFSPIPAPAFLEMRAATGESLRSLEGLENGTVITHPVVEEMWIAASYYEESDKLVHEYYLNADDGWQLYATEGIHIEEPGVLYLRSRNVETNETSQPVFLKFDNLTESADPEEPTDPPVDPEDLSIVLIDGPQPDRKGIRVEGMNEEVDITIQHKENEDIVLTQRTSNRLSWFFNLEDGEYEVVIEGKVLGTFRIGEVEEGEGEAEPPAITVDILDGPQPNRKGIRVNGVASADVTLMKDGEEVETKATANRVAWFFNLEDGEYDIFVLGEKHGSFTIGEPNNEDEEEEETDLSIEFLDAIQPDRKGIVVRGTPGNVVVTLKQGEDLIEEKMTANRTAWFFELADGEYEVYVGDVYLGSFVIGQEEQEDSDLSITILEAGREDRRGVHIQGASTDHMVSLYKDSELVEEKRTKQFITWFFDLAPGAYEIFIGDQQLGSFEVEGTEEEEDDLGFDLDELDLTVKEAALASTRGVYLDGLDGQQVNVTLHNEDVSYTQEVNDEGFSWFFNIEEGTYQVLVEGYQLAELVITEEDTLDIDVEALVVTVVQLEPGTRQLTIDGLSAYDLEYLEVELRKAGETAGKKTVTIDGQATFTDLIEGQYDVYLGGKRWETIDVTEAIHDLPDTAHVSIVATGRLYNYKSIQFPDFSGSGELTLLQGDEVIETRPVNGRQAVWFYGLLDGEYQVLLDGDIVYDTNGHPLTFAVAR
ncbi:hypothetical protein M3202_18470 [Alkalihalobacillus oceani]|uniref:Fibronectin type-III domain-containing protein n=1 Tax=Halalkalibacter oceani TaxID=1653776 RepID=A0A9X2DTW9_9BACI|nr:hypothetical protein [Halalkalibacter oceani]MCM3716040.1 hypothetical protein [Halalkalibacter oceani]